MAPLFVRNSTGNVILVATVHTGSHKSARRITAVVGRLFESGCTLELHTSRGVERRVAKRIGGRYYLRTA